MAKKIKKLTNIFGIVISLASWNYFNSPVSAIGLGIKADLNEESNNFIQKLQQIDAFTNHFKSIGVNIENPLETKENITAFNKISLNNDSSNLGLPKILSTELSNYLAIINHKKTDSQEDFSQIKVTQLTNQKAQLSTKNFLNYIANSFKQIRTDQPTNIAQSAKIAILPQTKANEIFKDMYDFDIELSKKEFDLNSSLGEMLNSQSDNNTDYLPANNLVNNFNTPKDYSGLQKQLIASVQVSQATSSPTQRAYGNNNRNFNSRANLPRVRNSWFQYYSIGEQYSNPKGLIDTPSNSITTKQLNLQQKVEQEIQQRMQFVN